MRRFLKSTRRHWRSLAHSGALALGLALGVPALASAQPAYYIANEWSANVLQPYATGWGATILTKLRPLGGAGAKSQQWFINDEGGGWVSFQNRYTKLCIHPSDWDPVAGVGARLLQASCTTTNGARMWRPIPSAEPNRFFYQSKKTGLFMDADGYWSGDPAVQRRLDYSSSEVWRPVYAGDF